MQGAVFIVVWSLKPNASIRSNVLSAAGKESKIFIFT